MARRETRTTYGNPDGSRTTRVYSGPVNYKDSTGAWKPIDTTIEADPSGGYRNAAGPVDFSFDAATGESDLVVAKGDGWSLGFSVDGQVPGRVAATQGSKVTYEDALPSADLSYLMGADSLKELVVLKSAPSTAADVHYSFPLSLQGLRAVAEGGGVAFYDSSGDVAMRVPPGMAWDSASSRAESPVTVSLSSKEGKSVIDLTVDGSWLTDSARRYPLFIDPSFEVGKTSGLDDAWVQSLNPNAINGLSADNRIGYHTSYGTTRTFQFFDLSALSGKRVLTATWNGYFRYSETQGSRTTYNLRPVNGSWNYNSLTWNNQPAVLSNIHTDTAMQGDWGAIDVTTWAANWVDGVWTNNGLRLDADGLGQAAYKWIAAEEAANQTQRPYLQITYNTPAPVPTLVSPTANATVLTTQPTLSVNPVTDAEGEPVQYWFRATTGTDAEGGQRANSGWISSTSWTVTQALLQDGVTYYWHVWTTDGINITDPVGTPIRSFKVDLRLGAGGTSPSDQIGPASVNLVTGNVALQTSSPSFPTAAGSIGLSYAYNSSTPLRRGLKATYSDDVNRNRLFDDTGGQNVRLVDPVVDFAWAQGSPYPSIPNDYWLARWTGYITVPTTGSWTFGAHHDDGVRIWIGGTQVLDWWQPDTDYLTPHWGTPTSLTAGTKVAIKVEYFDDAAWASMRLAMKGPGVSDDATVPADWLTPSDENVTDNPALPAGWSLSANAEGGLAYTEAKVTESSVVLVSPDGSTSTYTKTTTGWIPAPGEDGVLAKDAATGNLILDADGMIYTFRTDGTLASVTTSTDDLNPGAPTYTWAGSPVRLTAITDPISTRAVSLTYGGGSCPTAPAGFDASAPTGMLCKIAYWDTTQTNLFYVSS